MVSRRNILTTYSSYGTHKTTAPGFLKHYPALMDPRNFLQLITKYAPKDIVFWANKGRRLPIVSCQNIQDIRVRVIKLMGERTPGGKDTLTRIVDIVKSHNRIDDHKHKVTQIHPEVICMNLDAWYECISQSITADFALPLYFPDSGAAQKALTLLLRTYGTQRVSLILSQLLHDPLFPYCNLQDIPDRVLLEWCASHSYPHVLDKLKVNNPRIRTTQENIETRVESLIRPPALWAPEDPMESTAEDDTKSIDSNNSLFMDHDDDTKSIDSNNSLFMDDDDMEDAATQGSGSVDHYFQCCGTCLDNGVTNCEIDSSLRQPGQRCTRCEGTGEPCEDRSMRQRQGSLTLETFEQDYRKRQKYDGHVREKADENKRIPHPSVYTVFAARQQLYLLLLDETSARHGSPAKTSILCLPKKKPDEGKILTLIGSISESRAVDLVKEQDALLSTSASDKENIPGGTNAGRHNDDDEMEADDTEETIMATCGRLAERWETDGGPNNEVTND
jgi:hypothetical protein